MSISQSSSSINISSSTRINPEPRKFPFEQTFACPKCSEILLTKIYYIESTNIPQIQYTCPKRHNGTVDLPLFFNLFHASYPEVEEDVLKFDENLEKDIEAYKTKKINEGKYLDPINFEKLIKNKKKFENINNNENINIINNNNDKKENNININSNNPEKMTKCFEQEFSILKTLNIKNINLNKIIEDKFKLKEEIKKNLSPKTTTNNINIIKNINTNSPKKENQENKDNNKENKEKELYDENFLCLIHGKSRYTGYCYSCKKNMCKKCFKTRKHKSRKLFNKMQLNKRSNELNKSLNLCQESLNKFENKSKNLIDELSNSKDRNKKIILNIMSKAYIDINKEKLKEIKEIIKNYNNCVKNQMLNFEIIMSVKNIKIENVMSIPNDISLLIKIFKNYEDYLLQNGIEKKNNNSGDTENNENNENKYIQLFSAFYEISKKYENGDINFKEVVEDENFRKLINLNDYGNIDLNTKESKSLSDEEKELNEIEKMGYDKYSEEDCENFEDYLEEEEEENELEYDDDIDEYDGREIEEVYNYAINDNINDNMTMDKKENKEQ